MFGFDFCGVNHRKFSSLSISRKLELALEIENSCCLVAADETRARIAGKIVSFFVLNIQFVNIHIFVSCNLILKK